ncbi:universal stress protein [Desulfosarcina alkanivorans]|uniref:Universal stress protein n=1 Tax=Desulfosarcina alkanivorans TaxID=571177 RepID=A0A5K7YC00_9BACT|nr:universal stress protein [Desulfosarcina alkanivorans]BBO66113.1 universal stress protein [Desulfosarcina alkanivorans]
MKNITRILCPVDFSEPSHAALKFAVELAEHFSAKPILFHAITEIDLTPSPSHTLTQHIMDQIPQIMQQMKENAQRAIQELIDSLIEDRVQSLKLVEIGNPPTSIVNVAKDVKADLIIMATHGRSGVKGLFFGSVAEKVVRTADCPVLTIKHQPV